jgi:hypothetical protein
VEFDDKVCLNVGKRAKFARDMNGVVATESFSAPDPVDEFLREGPIDPADKIGGPAPRAFGLGNRLT